MNARAPASSAGASAMRFAAWLLRRRARAVVERRSARRMHRPAPRDARATRAHLSISVQALTEIALHTRIVLHADAASPRASGVAVSPRPGENARRAADARLPSLRALATLHELRTFCALAPAASPVHERRRAATGLARGRVPVAFEPAAPPALASRPRALLVRADARLTRAATAPGERLGVRRALPREPRRDDLPSSATAERGGSAPPPAARGPVAVAHLAASAVVERAAARRIEHAGIDTLARSRIGRSRAVMASAVEPAATAAANATPRDTVRERRDVELRTLERVLLDAGSAPLRAPPRVHAAARPHARDAGLEQELHEIRRTLQRRLNAPPAPAPAIDVADLGRRVLGDLERHARIERERRGL